MRSHIEKDLRIVTGRINMQVPDKQLGDIMDIFMDERQYPETGQEDDGPFGPLEERYDMKSSNL
jgi:hypothetical protein